MRLPRVRWRWFLTYLLLACITLLFLSCISAVLLRQDYLAQVTENLELKARLGVNRLEVPLVSARYDLVETACRDLGRSLDVRFTVILPNGVVVADSAEDPSRMGNHGVRDEVVGALAGNTTTVQHFSFTLRQDMLYLAAPFWHQGRILAAIRVALPEAAVSGHLLRLYGRLGFGFLGGLVLAAAIGWFFSFRIGRAWEAVAQGVQRYTRGDLTSKIPTSDVDTQPLAEHLNRMAAELDHRLRTAVLQQHEQEAVLAAMVEGVLVVDGQTRLHNLNQAAEALLGISASQAIGRLLPEVLRNSQLLELVNQTLATETPVEGDILLAGDPEKHLQAHGTRLRDAQDRQPGALLVLHDVTRLRRLENIRKEFVANVSHELKTPITLIQGFLETIQEGAKNKPEDLDHFLEIMTTQANRLNLIIEDLLNLSRLEQDTERGQIDLSRQALRPILMAAVAACRGRAQSRKISLDLTCAEDLAAQVNPRLLEQALINLIDNAVKYSDAGGRVAVSAEQTPAEVVLTVRDQGVGIEAEHLPRLFERFYRVDKGRSRDLGGTGLGLAIVKHILQAHGGRVTVASVPGQGSTFSLHLPSR